MAFQRSSPGPGGCGTHLLGLARRQVLPEVQNAVADAMSTSTRACADVSATQAQRLEATWHAPSAPI
ncbi:unnamed protein product [Prunus armeniaca]